ncbi:putative ATE1 [Lyophyllum shimeji]|uniref:arginyltransferase n=1 Tax=Lyophyllum shimeji TaxID=47721 RepID=A0A9P3UJT0_LYOSH|nr:putative ATE1 [Lyophyllum shimeji]
MENPHAERQAILLERILKNTSKCTEMLHELNHCMEEILRANAYIKTAADLATKYRKNRSEERSSRHTASLSAFRLSCDVYQRMIDRGWRRSGKYCYKPDLKRSCCPQYTIRLDALAFNPSRSQRKLVNRWNRFVIAGEAGEHMNTGPEIAKKMPMKMPPFSLVDSIHTSESGFGEGSATSSHEFEITLEPSSFTEEKYALFEKYQRTVHSDEATPSGFKRFLVDSPLLEEPIPYANVPPSHLPRNYGSYHQLYRLDGQLIAMGVIDILPHCVSSVYFMYDVEWEKFSLGKLSALREIALAREMHDAGAPGMDFLYMGFYIHSCQKMRYKGEYSPSYLADPETYDWFPLPSCLPLLEANRYAVFSHPERSLNGFPDEEEDIAELVPLDEDDLDQILVVSGVRDNKILTRPIKTTTAWDYEEIRDEALACVYALGMDTAKDVLLTF